MFFVLWEAGGFCNSPITCPLQPVGCQEEQHLRSLMGPLSSAPLLTDKKTQAQERGTCVSHIDFWLSFIRVTYSYLQIWGGMGFLFVSETALQTRGVIACPGSLGVGHFLGCEPFSSQTGWVLENQNVRHSADHSGGLLTRSAPVLCHERPEHLLVSRFPQRWKERGLMVRRGAQRTEDSFQGHMEWSKTSPGISQLFLVTSQQKME